MSPPHAAIEVSGLAKHFGPASALAGIDLVVPAGRFLTVFGPNGAGKTTLVRILGTLARPSAGGVRIHGIEVNKAGADLRRRIGFVSHRSLLYPALSAYENIVFFARMFGVENPRERARAILATMGLEHRMEDPVETYSRGMEQRCAIARGLVHEPDILLLDEPFSGLDADAKGRLSGLLRDLGGDTTVLLTTHDLAIGTELADHVVVLHRGRLTFDAPVTEIADGEMVAIYRRATGGRRR